MHANLRKHGLDVEHTLDRVFYLGELEEHRVVRRDLARAKYWPEIELSAQSQGCVEVVRLGVDLSETQRAGAVLLPLVFPG